uniref:Major facilitator superfamily (MFS) profile domain-containing protein n=1 Tax=Parascaris univalens TaxID=6257 RepID=A0A915AJW4_PARUN
MVSGAICMLTLALCLSSGFQQGYIATVLNQPYLAIEKFINESWLTRSDVPISANALNVLWASLNVVFPAATIAGQFLAAILCNRIGRKRTAILATCLYVPGAALSFMAKYCHPFFELLFIGRFIWSLANGINSVNATVWIIECAPPKHRGRMAALQEVFMATGSLLCQTVGVPFSTDELWPNVFLPPMVVAIATAMILCFTWESPQYIIDSERNLGKARNALAFYHGTESHSTSIDAELKVCQQSLMKNTRKSTEHSDDDGEHKHDGMTIMFNAFKANDPVSKVIRHGAWVGVMVKVAYVFTGARCLRAYSTFVLHSMAHWSLPSALYGSFAIGLLRLPFTLVPVMLVDRAGRRPLILISMVVSLVSQIALMVGALFGLSCLLLVNACGLGSVSRFYSAELVPRHLLLNSVALLTIFEAIMKIALEFSFYPIANIVGGSSMLLFACPSTVFFILTWYLCPETSGKHANEVLNSIACSKHLKISFNA